MLPHCVLFGVRGVARQFRGCGTRHLLVGTIMATNLKSLNGGCGTSKIVAALSHVLHFGDASVWWHNRGNLFISSLRFISKTTHFDTTIVLSSDSKLPS